MPRHRPPLAVLLSVLCALVPATLAAQVVDGPSAIPARVIVKFKAGSGLQTLQAVAPAAMPARRAEVLARRLGVALGAGHAIADHIQVVTAPGMSSRELAARLAQDSDVEYAVPDERRRRLAAPNDPLYGAGVSGTGPAAGQWYLRAPAGTVTAPLDVENAWRITRGDPGVVVAVIDTGVRFDHPDLLPVAAGGPLLPGYDMVSDAGVANDGGGRDADASDPGDWITEAEANDARGEFHQCTVLDPATGRYVAEDSSWHGTQVAGVVAALIGNGTGMAGVAPNVRVLPVRVLGKCGGFDSDIIAGMRWAAGLAVPGVPANPNRARVVNLSLGSEGACPAAYRDAVAEIAAAGAVVVAAAGNSAGHAVGLPANCGGVIAVAGLRHAGNKVGFSDLGPEVSVSAPAGNCINIDPGTPCLYPILTTTNAGATTPAVPGYTDSYNASLGTSFSAPLASGVVALMLSAQPGLAPVQVRELLRATARKFPATGGDNGDGTVVPQCSAPRFDSAGKPIDQLQCYCTTSTCGAGMLDAGAAVLAAASGPNAATVVEYYHAAFDHYFISWVPEEIAVLDAGTPIRGWARTGHVFTTYRNAQAGTSPVCRYYIPPAVGDSHFFGRGVAECDATGRNNPSFVLEAGEFMQTFLPAAGACPANTVPVYRVFSNRRDANHRYMTERAVRDAMVAQGWLAEGDGPDLVVMCAPR